jgi:hypothetical protein
MGLNKTMHVFIVDAKNQVKVHAAERTSLSKGGNTFVSSEGLATLTAHWPGTRLVEIWNKLPNVKEVRKFRDRRTAIQRIWHAVQDSKSPRAARSGAQAPATRGLRTRIDPARVRRDTKTERIIALLKLPSGATLSELMEETSWQRHSLRAFVSQLPRRFGFRLKSYKRDGERAYRVG